MGKRVCCMTASMRGRGGSSGHGWFRMSRALFSGSASPRAHCLRPRRARRDAAAAAAQCALQCMLAVKQRRRLTERVLSVLNVRGPSTGRVGRLSGCQARAALAHTPSIFRWSFFFYYSYTVLPPFPDMGPEMKWKKNLVDPAHRADPRRRARAHSGSRPLATAWHRPICLKPSQVLRPNSNTDARRDGAQQQGARYRCRRARRRRRSS